MQREVLLVARLTFDEVEEDSHEVNREVLASFTNRFHNDVLARDVMLDVTIANIHRFQVPGSTGT